MMDNPDGNIGRILKQRREELGRTLQSAQEETRIRKSYLESLENNRFSELPGETYVKGFIRVYASYLGLKSSPLLALLNDLHSDDTSPVATEPAEPATKSQPVQRAKHAADGGWRKFLLVFIPVLLLACLFYILMTTFFSNEQVDESATRATESGVTPAASAKPQAELDNAPAVPEQPQSATAQARADGSGEQLPAPVSAPPATGTEPQKQDSQNRPVIPSGGASLRMLALADSSLIIKVDERKAEQYKLYDGLDLTWKIKQNVSVEFATSDVARFWLNGQEIDLAGEKSFALTPAAE